MKLITKEIEKKLQKKPLYSQDEKGDQAEIICKFFAPIGGYTWYVMEAEMQENGDYIFFGLVINNYQERELGYFTLNELEEIKLPFGLKIERDLYFESCKIGDI